MIFRTDRRERKDTNMNPYTYVPDAGKLEQMKHPHVFLRYPGGRAKAVTFSFDDGVVEDAWLARELRRRGMRATFNVNAGLCTYDVPDYEKLDPSYFPVKSIQRRLTVEELRAAFGEGIDAGDIEIACHAYTHAQLTLLDSGAVAWELCRDRAALEALTGAPVRGFAYPQGAASDAVADALRACGLAYGRLAWSTGGFALPEDPYRFAPTCHFLEENAPTLAEQYVALPVSEGVFGWHTQPTLCYIWGHGYEMRTEADYARAAALFDTLAGHDDVWYPTNIEWFDYKAAFDRLIFGIDRTVVQNPSAIPVWVLANGQIRELAPGAVVQL